MGKTAGWHERMGEIQVGRFSIYADDPYVLVRCKGARRQQAVSLQAETKGRRGCGGDVQATPMHNAAGVLWVRSALQPEPLPNYRGGNKSSAPTQPVPIC